MGESHAVWPLERGLERAVVMVSMHDCASVDSYVRMPFCCWRRVKWQVVRQPILDSHGA
jgi:hypothetical protein